MLPLAVTVARRIREMNEWGPEGCRQNIDTIVGWMLEEAGKKRQRTVRDENGQPKKDADGQTLVRESWSWWQLATGVPLTTRLIDNPVGRATIEKMIVSAIEEAEKLESEIPVEQRRKRRSIPEPQRKVNDMFVYLYNVKFSPAGSDAQKTLRVVAPTWRP